MRATLIILIILFSKLFVLGTEQVPDILYWNNDTLELYESPLENYHEITKKLFNDKKKFSVSSVCWRRYVAEWTIVDNELFLINIESCVDNISLNERISEITKRKFINGMLRADWIDGKFWCGTNYSYFNLYSNVFINEYLLDIQHGQLSSIKKSQADSCDFRAGNNELLNLLYSNVNWNEIPSLEKDNTVLIAIGTNIDGEIFNIQITSKSEIELLNKEALRVCNLLLCLQPYFHQGEYFNVPVDLELCFSERNKKKYNR